MAEGIRLNKYLSAAGICSRREADRLIEKGQVYVNNLRAEAGMKVKPSDKISVNGSEVRPEKEFILLAVYKPKGIICSTTDQRVGDRTIAGETDINIVDFLNFPKRIYPVGRLDKDSEGLILMTNQGDLVNKILRGSNQHEKEYLVKIYQPVTAGFLQKMAEGVNILDTKTKPCRVEKTGTHSFRIILTQGLNRQIRRMCEALGTRVKYLKRVRVMNIRLDELNPGKYRKIEGKELREFLTLLKESSSLPEKQR